MKGEKGDPGIHLQGSPGPQGRYIPLSHSLFSHTVHAILYNTHREHESSQYSKVSIASHTHKFVPVLHILIL